jgi:hypothetical protein
MKLKSLYRTDLPLEVKVFEIDTAFYEFNNKKKQEIIFHIVKQHQKRVGDNTEVGKVISTSKLDDIEYYTYVYNEPEKDSHWKGFLPGVIQDSHNFGVKTYLLYYSQQLRIKYFRLLEEMVYK